MGKLSQCHYSVIDWKMSSSPYITADILSFKQKKSKLEDDLFIYVFVKEGKKKGREEEAGHG